MILSEDAYKEVFGLFRPGQRVAICGHINPDGDAIGSAVALSIFLKGIGCRVTKLLAAESCPPELYAFLPDYQFMAAADYQQRPDIFVAVDLSQADRLGKAKRLIEEAGQTVVIDHHLGYDGFADHALSAPGAAAAGLLVWELIEASGRPVGKDIATACYVALMTDTGRFAYQNTDAQVLATAARMVEAGADPAALYSHVYEMRPEGSVKLDARLIDRMDYLDDQQQVVCSWVDLSDFSELGVARDDTEGLPSLLRSLKGVEIAILLRCEPDGVRVNLRSKNSYDVGELANHFGGGGHAGAAGFTFAGGLESVREAIAAHLRTQGFSV